LILLNLLLGESQTGTDFTVLPRLEPPPDKKKILLKNSRENDGSKTVSQPTEHTGCSAFSTVPSKERIKGVMTRSIVDALSELCSPFLKGSNSVFSAAIASGLFPQTEYRSLE